MVRMVAMASIALLSLAGCQAWVKPGATEADHRLQTYQCEKDVRQSEFGGGLAGALGQRSFFDRCMEAHGWSKQDSSLPAPPSTLR